MKENSLMPVHCSVAEIDAELKGVKDRIVAMIGELSQ